MDDTFCERVEPLTPLSQQRADEDRSVSRMQRLFPEKLRDLCHMHLAFILDFSDRKLEDMLSEGGPCGHKIKQALTHVFKNKDKSNQGLFGVPLTENGVSLMMPLIAYLRKEENVEKEGLFRKAGNGRKMKQLKEQLISEGADININAEQYGPHDVACVLKEFLRELPEPLLTYKHMEAHRQIRSLGGHACTAEEKERYFQKKLSAVQYLMRLMPVPRQKMVRYLFKLLSKVAAEPGSKMTAETLGTIFAPICFLSRKVSASDMCEVVSETESSVAFMIEHSRRLFEVPKELVTDVVRFWKDQENYSPSPERHYNNSGMKKWPSGPIVNTNVCYIDRQASSMEDSAKTTQVELASLLAHIESLPDTPHNLKLKKQIQKGTTTPIKSCQQHRSKSIGSSIRKRLPSLTRTKQKDTEISFLGSSGTSSISECLSITPIMSDLINSPTTTKSTARHSRSRQKRPHPRLQEKTTHCTPPKRSYHRSHSRDLFLKENLSIMDVSCTPFNTNKSCSLGSIKTHVLSPNQQCVNKPTQNQQQNLSASIDRLNDLMPVKKSPRDTRQILNNSNGCLNPYSTALSTNCDIKSSKTTRKPCLHDSLNENTENEITYVPYHGTSELLLIHTPQTSNTKRRNDVPLRKCNGQVTPIMKRAVFQLTSHHFETSI